MNQSRLDPRNFQIATLLLLLDSNFLAPSRLETLIFINSFSYLCFLHQWLGTRWAALPRFEV